MPNVHTPYSLSLKRGSAKPTELFNYIGSSQSDIMENTTLYSGILLVVLAGFGVIYELARHIRGRNFPLLTFQLIKKFSFQIFLNILIILGRRWISNDFTFCYFLFQNCISIKHLSQTGLARIKNNFNATIPVLDFHSL